MKKHEKIALVLVAIVGFVGITLACMPICKMCEHKFALRKVEGYSMCGVCYDYFPNSFREVIIANATH